MIQLCQEYTSLSPDDIEALLHSAQQVEKNPHYEEIDVFIDVYNEMKKRSIGDLSQAAKDSKILIQTRYCRRRCLIKK